MKKSLALIAFIALCTAVAAAGCAPHIAPYKAKHRKYDAGSFGARSRPTNGSLYAEGSVGLFEDAIAGRIGDILIVKIDEKDLASRQADTKLDKADATSYGLPNAVGFVAALQKKYPDVDPGKLFASTSEQKFTGNGSVARQGHVSAILPVRVMQILPSGDLFVEGTKVVMVGHEEHHIYLSGIVRRIDIAEDNTVPSSRIADAEIEYTGRGDVSDTQRRGWLNRVLGKIWPF
ncbi:MAG: flagellar basal body L-ring protein FlgH [Deltaproteobacteria bacterium]|nr:flagellar basal body L-ring protein FlgH [Deltaproteobacteria bacterium]